MRPQKFYFEFSYCKVLELVEYLTPFRTDYLIQIFVMNRGIHLTGLPQLGKVQNFFAVLESLLILFKRPEKYLEGFPYFTGTK